MGILGKSARLACAGATAFGLVALPAVPASAEVEPTGKFTADLKFTIKLEIVEIPESFTVTGKLTGTVDKEGNISIRKSGVKINPALNQTFGEGTVTVPKIAFTPTGNWSGGIDPKSGFISLTGPFKVVNTVSAPAVADACPIGPITLNLSTKQAGGKKYNPTTGKATLVDSTYIIPKFGPDYSVPGCNGTETVFNAFLVLPTGNSTTIVEVTVSPKLTGDGTTTPVTALAPTTTTVPVPETTVAPIAAPTELPRTGSSELPLAIAGGVFVLAGAALVGRKRRAA